jgi:hypothetical protein
MRGTRTRRLRATELGMAIGMTGTHIRRLCHSQEIRGHRDGRYWHIYLDDALAWLSTRPALLAKALIYFENKHPRG